MNLKKEMIIENNININKVINGILYNIKGGEINYTGIVFMLSAIVYKLKKTTEFVAKGTNNLSSRNYSGNNRNFIKNNLPPNYGNIQELENYYKNIPLYKALEELQYGQKANYVDLVEFFAQKVKFWPGTVLSNVGVITFGSNLQNNLPVDLQKVTGHHGFALTTPNSKYVDVVVATHSSNIMQIRNYDDYQGNRKAFASDPISILDFNGQKRRQYVWGPILRLNANDVSIVAPSPDYYDRFLNENCIPLAQFFLQNKWIYYDGRYGILYVDSSGVAHHAPAKFNDFVP